LIFFGVDVVGDCHQVPFVPHAFAQHLKQGGFARAHRATNTDAKGWEFFGAMRNVVE
jgi:hypothetical protein